MTRITSDPLNLVRIILSDPKQYHALIKSYSLKKIVGIFLIWAIVAAILQGVGASMRLQPRLYEAADSLLAEVTSQYPEDLEISYANGQLSISQDPLIIERPWWLEDSYPPVLFSFSSSDQNSGEKSLIAANQHDLTISLDQAQRTISWSELIDHSQEISITPDTLPTQANYVHSVILRMIQYLPVFALALSWLVLAPGMLLTLLIELGLFVLAQRLFTPAVARPSTHSIVKMGLLLGCFALTTSTLVYLVHPHTQLLARGWLSGSFWVAAVIVLLQKSSSQKV